MNVTKTKSRSSNLLNNAVWNWAIDNYGGRAGASILIVTNNKQNKKNFEDEGLVHVDHYTPESLRKQPSLNQYQISVLFIKKNSINNQEEFDDLLYEIAERTMREGRIFISSYKELEFIEATLAHQDKKEWIYFI